ncbi:MAG TPA: SMP-30/gluconolactonase/LRE family protein [Limnochordia bacterium]
MEVVTDVQSTLGEGPIWYGERLYWVDILEKKVHSYAPDRNEVRTLQLDQFVGTVVPRRRGGLVVALQNGFAFLAEDGTVTPIADPEADKPDNRFNDGKCDPAGRFWAGTMPMDEQRPVGSLYMLDLQGQVHRKLSGVTISNGICWSDDGKTMYYIDTPTHQVIAYQFDMDSGEIRDPRTVVTIDPRDGAPDGMTIDERGYLWIGLWGGYAVVCYDPASGRRVAKLDVPVARVTACAFGGPDLGDLYITTARVGLSEADAAREPLAGRLFKTRVDVKGVPAFAYGA